MLSDYSKAAGAIVALQRKLSKAIKEAATLRTTNEIAGKLTFPNPSIGRSHDMAGNALNVSASIFDVLSDVDAKFAKIADKEYDSISSEVDKWFKKLAVRFTFLALPRPRSLTH
jgi:hypothetical protein